MKKLYFFVLMFGAIAIITGCTGVKKQSPVRTGVFKSIDKGNTWTMKDLLVVNGGLGRINNLSVTGMYVDPQDNNAIYLTTLGNGIFYTYNGGENWQQPPQLSSGTISKLTVDTKDKCIIYATIGNRILKSLDCNRSYQEVYLDSRPIAIVALAIHPENSSEIYIATNKGEILRSEDGTRSWNTLYNLRTEIINLIIDPDNTDILYVASKKGLYKSFDGGSSWQDINAGLKKFSNANLASHILINPAIENSILIVTKYGILRSDNGGIDWSAYNLLTPPLSTQIFSIAMSPKTDNELYYTTGSAYYKTQDGGKNWIVKRLPTAARPTSLLIDPVNPSIIYLSTFIIPTK